MLMFVDWTHPMVRPAPVVQHIYGVTNKATYRNLSLLQSNNDKDRHHIREVDSIKILQLKFYECHNEQQFPDSVKRKRLRKTVFVDTALYRSFVYPEIALHYGIEGRTTLVFQFDAAGQINLTHIESSMNSFFDGVMADVIRKGRFFTFKPKKGTPKNKQLAWGLIEIRWTLKPPLPPDPKNQIPIQSGTK